MPDQKKETVHTRHCTWNYCKYGEEDYCEVYLGLAEPDITKDWEYDNAPIIKPIEAEFKRRRDLAKSRMYDDF